MISGRPRPDLRVQTTFHDFRRRVNPVLAAGRVFKTRGGREALARELERLNRGDVVTAKLLSAGRIVREGADWEVARQALEGALHVMDAGERLSFERRLRSLRVASFTVGPVFKALVESRQLYDLLSGIIRKEPMAMGRDLRHPVPGIKSEFEGVWFSLSSRERNAVVREARRILKSSFKPKVDEEE